jgi:hypothetical protein
MTNILSQWYKEISHTISIEEVKQTINHRSSKSAPGRNQLPYIAYKHLNTSAIEQLTKIYNSILTEGITPREWSRGTIYPIPKPKDWENNLNITRPITLLDAGRKIFTKIITDRLAKTIAEHSILSELN